MKYYIEIVEDAPDVFTITVENYNCVAGRASSTRPVSDTVELIRKLMKEDGYAGKRGPKRPRKVVAVPAELNLESSN